MRICWLQSLVVRVLGAVYEWSARRYQRERFRQGLWRVQRDLAARRRSETREDERTG